MGGAVREAAAALWLADAATARVRRDGGRVCFASGERARRGCLAPPSLPRPRLHRWDSPDVGQVIVLWRDDKCILSWEAHEQCINALCALPDDVLASASDDHTIRLWRSTQNGWQCAATLDGHSSTVSTLATLAGDYLASASFVDDSGEIWLWREGRHTASDATPLLSVARNADDGTPAGSGGMRELSHHLSMRVLMILTRVLPSAPTSAGI